MDKVYRIATIAILVIMSSILVPSIATSGQDMNFEDSLETFEVPNYVDTFNIIGTGSYTTGDGAERGEHSLTLNQDGVFEFENESEANINVQDDQGVYLPIYTYELDSDGEYTNVNQINEGNEDGFVTVDEGEELVVTYQLDDQGGTFTDEDGEQFSPEQTWTAKLNITSLDHTSEEGQYEFSVDGGEYYILFDGEDNRETISALFSLLGIMFILFILSTVYNLGVRDLQ